MLRYAVAVTVALAVGSEFSTAQPAPCSPISAPTEVQLARRRLAITAARQINTEQARAWAANKRYASRAELTGVTISEGFEAQISTDATSYTFSIKDLQDACKSAVFSDQKGLIYTATPLQ